MKTKPRNLLILSLLLLLPSLVVAQMPLNDCGYIRMGLCLLFESDNYGTYMMSGGIDSYNVGDHVKIHGDVRFDVMTTCMQGEGVIFDYILLDCESDYTCGDIIGDENIDINDVIFLINYLYKGGPPPESLASANVDFDTRRDSTINILDVIRLINFKYKDGPPPSCP